MQIEKDNMILCIGKQTTLQPLELSEFIKVAGVLEFRRLTCLFHACLLSYSVESDSMTPWAVAHQAPLSRGFPRQEYWSGLLFPPPGDLPNPGIDPHLLLWQVGSLPLSHLGSLSFPYVSFSSPYKTQTVAFLYIESY